MKRMRLKEECVYPTMSLPYGIVLNYEWKDVPDDTYEPREAEIFGRKKLTVKETPVASVVEVAPVKSKETSKPRVTVKAAKKSRAIKRKKK